MNKELIYLLYETSIKMLKTIDELSKDFINDQEYINWKDNLNILSIDPNQ